METTFRIVPRKGTYQVEAVAPNGTRKVIEIWPTEEMAVSHLKELRRSAQLAARQANPGERDWRG